MWSDFDNKKLQKWSIQPHTFTLFINFVKGYCRKYMQETPEPDLQNSTDQSILLIFKLNPKWGKEWIIKIEFILLKLFCWLTFYFIANLKSLDSHKRNSNSTSYKRKLNGWTREAEWMNHRSRMNEQAKPNELTNDFEWINKRSIVNDQAKSNE